MASLIEDLHSDKENPRHGVPSSGHVATVLAQKEYSKSMCIAGTEDRESSVSQPDKKKVLRSLGVGHRSIMETKVRESKKKKQK